jgi:hypothetical protein
MCRKTLRSPRHHFNARTQPRGFPGCVRDCNEPRLLDGQADEQLAALYLGLLVRDLLAF